MENIVELREDHTDFRTGWKTAMAQATYLYKNWLSDARADNVFVDAPQDRAAVLLVDDVWRVGLDATLRVPSPRPGEVSESLMHLAPRQRIVGVLSGDELPLSVDSIGVDGCN